MKQTLEEAEREYCCRNFPYSEHLHLTIGNAFDAGAEWQAKQSPWISVEERLPELMERVLVAHHLIGRISICIMKRVPLETLNPDNPKWAWSLANRKGDVIAWTPIPTFDQIFEDNPELLKGGTK